MSNPVEKKSFEDRIQREYKTKIEAMTKLNPREKEILTLKHT